MYGDRPNQRDDSTVGRREGSATTSASRRGVLRGIAGTTALGLGSAVGVEGVVAGENERTHRRRLSADGVAVEGSVAAGRFQQEARLAAEDGDSVDQFGEEVDVSGDTAIVGAPFDEDPNGQYCGSAYVFVEDSDRWTQQAKLAAEDGESRDFFGFSVAVSGDTAFVGVPGDEGPSTSKGGSVYVFERDGEDWSMQTKLTDDVGNEDGIGYAVAADGDTLVATDTGEDDPNGSNSGAAYVFERSDGGWSLQDKLVAEDGDSGDALGNSVDVANDTVVVGGAREEDPNGENSGAAYVFERIAGSWRQETKLLPDDGDSKDFFGNSVAVSVKTILVGAFGDEDPNGTQAGAAYVFSKSGGAWRQETKVVDPKGKPDDGFGSSVALTETVGLVGATFDGDGSVLVFDRGESWSEPAQRIGRAGINLGNAVAISGDTVVAGASRSSQPNGENSGAAFVFQPKAPVPEKYYNDQGVVTTDLLKAAIRDWATKQLSTETLQTVIRFWATGEDVRDA